MNLISTPIDSKCLNGLGKGMSAALKDVKSGISINKAAIRHGINRSALKGSTILKEAHKA